MTAEHQSAYPCRFGCGKKLYWRADIPFEDENFTQRHWCVNKPKRRSEDERITRLERLSGINDGGYF